MSCTYGPHQHGNEDQGWVAHFAICALEGREITVYGDGCQVRDILYVDDLVDAMLLARERVDAVAGLAFNMGGGAEHAVSLVEVLDLLADLGGVAPEFSSAETRTGDQRYYVADSRRFRAATGWRPRVGAAEGIERLHRWLAEERAPAAPLRAVAQ
jgi:CDP-paratose 2-epimerase